MVNTGPSSTMLEKIGAKASGKVDKKNKKDKSGKNTSRLMQSMKKK